MNVDMMRIFIAWPMLSALPLFAAYGHLLKRIGVERDDLLVPGVALAAITGLLLAFLRLYFLERTRVRMLTHTSRRDDGAHVVEGGRLRAGQTPLLSPLDGNPCGLYTWTIEVLRRKQAARMIGRGVALADAVLVSSVGGLALQGVPDVKDVDWQLVQEPAVLARFARLLLEDGLIGLAESGVTQTPTPDITGSAGIDSDGIRWGSLAAGYILAVPWDAINARYASGDRESAVRQLAECLHASDCITHVAVLPIGAEVTSVGRWNGANGRLSVGVEPGRWQGILGLPMPKLATRGQRRMRLALFAVGVLGFAVAAVLAWTTGAI